MIGKSPIKQHYPKKNYINLKVEEITDADYMHGNKDFEIKDLCEHYDFYLKNDTLLLADVFENFGNMRIKSYQSDPVKFL